MEWRGLTLNVIEKTEGTRTRLSCSLQWGKGEVLAKIASAIKFGLRNRPEFPIESERSGSGPGRWHYYQLF